MTPVWDLTRLRSLYRNFSLSDFNEAQLVYNERSLAMPLRKARHAATDNPVA